MGIQREITILDLAWLAVQRRVGRLSRMRSETRHRRLVPLILGNLAILAILIVLIEGLSSIAFTAMKYTHHEPIAEELHTEYDAELGWVNKRNFASPDMYGKGLGLHTNSERFRGTRDVTPTKSASVIRAICSGDSFALGFGVADDETWCHQLQNLDSRLETVNMGQGGYGVGQSYLWYLRGAEQIDHDIQLFTFTSTDFYRMQTDDFLGFAKPLVTLSEGKLMVENVPVPRWSYLMPWFARNGAEFSRLRTVRMTQDLARRLRGGGRTRESQNQQKLDRHTENVLEVLFAELARINRERSSIPVVVYLPSINDYYARTESPWRSRSARLAKGAGLDYVDLVDDIRSITRRHIDSLFIQPGQVKYPHSEYHYNARGNEFIARALYSKISKISAIAKRLSSRNG